MDGQADEEFFGQDPMDVTPEQILTKALEIAKRDDAESVIVMMFSEKEDTEHFGPRGAVMMHAGFDDQRLLVGSLEMAKTIVLQNMLGGEGDGI